MAIFQALRNSRLIMFMTLHKCLIKMGSPQGSTFFLWLGKFFRQKLFKVSESKSSFGKSTIQQLGQLWKIKVKIFQIPKRRNPSQKANKTYHTIVKWAKKNPLKRSDPLFIEDDKIYGKWNKSWRRKKNI